MEEEEKHSKLHERANMTEKEEEMAQKWELPDGRASVVWMEECLVGGLSVPETGRAQAHRLPGFLGNDHPQECQARPSALGSVSRLSPSLLDAAKDRCPSAVWKLTRQNLWTEIPP